MVFEWKAETMLEKEICPDVRFAYPEGAYTMLYEYEDGAPIQAWDIVPHNYFSAFPLIIAMEGDYVAYTVLPQSE